MARSLRTRLFQSWFRLTRPMTLGVRGLVTDDEGRIGLVRHSYVPGWMLPGGGVEKGETAGVALARELAEELGVSLDGTPVLFGVYANAASFPNDHVLLYRVTTWKACPPRAGAEIAERGFFPRDRLPEGTTAGTRARLAEVFDGVPPAPDW